MSKNTEIVDAFVAAWGRRDLQGILDYFTDDALYINIPMDPPNEGKEAIQKALEGFIGMASEIEFVVHHQGETPDGRVLNERTDRFKIGDSWIELPVMGIFELRGEKICAWRDYFDVGMFQSQMPGAES